MHVEYHKWWSQNLQRDMEYKVFGHSGMALLVFPCQDGRFFDWENMGMVNTISNLIEEGRVRLICVDSIDKETWSDKGNWDKRWRIEQHERWFKYVCDEVLPNVRHYDGEQFMTAGASMGGFHAANFFLRRPELFFGMLSLSGLFNGSYGFDDWMDGLVYENSPQDYMQNMPEDHYLMQQYRNNKKIVFSVGQGAWEDALLWSTREMDRIFAEKHIPAWFYYWGYDTEHDWPAWRHQLPFFVNQLL